MSLYYSTALMKRLRDKRLFLFDLDRTLVETDWNYLLSVVHRSIHRCGGTIFPDATQMEDFWFGNSMNRDDFIRKVLRLRPADFWREHQQLDTPANRLANTDIIFGVKQSLDQLEGSHKLTGVITAARPIIAQAELSLLEFDFDVVLALADHPELPTKPEPDGLRDIMIRLGCSCEEVVYTGDSWEDYLFAKAAGVDFIHYLPDRWSLTFQLPPLVSFYNWSNSPFLQM